MKKIISFLASLAMLAELSGCGAAPSPDEDSLIVAATTYPVYLLASAVAEGAEGVEITAVVNQSVACVHDYTLSIRDMKTIELADCILLSGAGLDDFMSDAIGERPTVDCSVGVELLCSNHSHDHNHDHEDFGEAHHHHDHGEYDPHIWMDPQNAALMTGTIAAALAEMDPKNAQLYLTNCEEQIAELLRFSDWCSEELSDLDCRELITFHEGFGYLAHACKLEILSAIEEEAGSEASAQKIVEMVELIEQHSIPVIFVEHNGSDATAQAIHRECGVEVAPLSMLMSGEAYSHDNNYISLMTENIKTLKEALK